MPWFFFWMLFGRQSNCNDTAPPSSAKQVTCVLLTVSLIAIVGVFWPQGYAWITGSAERVNNVLAVSEYTSWTPLWEPLEMEGTHNGIVLQVCHSSAADALVTRPAHYPDLLDMMEKLPGGEWWAPAYFTGYLFLLFAVGVAAGILTFEWLAPRTDEADGALAC